MSLKAKLEAVIYAAEEPVTLAQLAVLFTADVMEWKAEQEAEAAELAAAATGQFSETGEPLPPLNGEFDYAAPELAVVAPEHEPVMPAIDPGDEAEPELVPAELAEADAAEGEDAEAESIQQSAELGAEPETTAADEASAESELKKQARQRDREVRGILRQLLNELIESYASDSRGVEIREIAGGYRMATKPECHDAVRSFVKSLKPALRLSLPALETLAVVAYKQPVTAPEVNEIRGVDSSGVFGSLLARKLIATAGRKQVIGRPILYKTTKEFLLRFGLKDVSELPSMEEFEKMAAIELDEPDVVSEGESAPQIREDLRLELDQTTVDETAGEVTESPAPLIAADHTRAPETEITTPEAAPAAPPPEE